MTFDLILFRKAVSQFLVPPGLFIGILILLSLRLLFKKQWSAGLITFIIAGSMWLLSISPVTDRMLRGLEEGFSIPEHPQGDVIILLGGGINEGVADLSGVGAPSEESLSRIVTVVRLQRRLNLPVIVSAGQAFREKKAEASIAKRYLVDLGVPEAKVIIEEKSSNTYENAKYSKEICEKMGYRHPILVTSAYHMRRALSSFEKMGFKVFPYPAGFRTWANRKYLWLDYLPGEFDAARIAIHEYIGLLLYRLIY
jgi:uncharacterized SAM-binding protein YcdF (DUF218 family)